MTRAIMVQGTGSNVGKSMLVAGLCRAARRRGLCVAPFKPQNMSNNAAVTVDGGEIGRAQALQALAAGVPFHSDMNPVLIKPETDIGASVIVHGKRLCSTSAAEYQALRPQFLDRVMESFERLKSAHDLVIVEGAGSPAEVNLRHGDIANMGFARRADVPVILAGDIDRGGVIAQIIGTQSVIDPDDAAMIAGFLINKFRGDLRLFNDGYEFVKQRTGWTGFGVLPWFRDAWKLPAEDAIDLGAPKPMGGFHIACLALSRIANFDDLDPLTQEPDVRLTMVGPGRVIPRNADLIVIPGTKSTRLDMQFLRSQGWDIDIFAHVRRGGHVLGICGGYQILGQTIQDPGGIEGDQGMEQGLGLLQIDTTMAPEKRLGRISAKHVGTGQVFDGYEIHIGRTTGPDCVRPFAMIDNTPEGATDPTGRIMGSYLHGMFNSDAFRAAWLAQFGVKSQVNYSQDVESTLDALAQHLETHLDIDAIFAAAR